MLSLSLSLKFDKLNVSTVSPTSISSPCGACGVIGHTSIKCQLGSAAESVEQINFVQNNQESRQKQNFYNNPQHPFGQTAPSNHANAQRVAQNSSLKFLIETYFSNQSKELQELKNQTGFLNDSLAKLTSKVGFIFFHNKILETQISQLTHKVSQHKTNKMNFITLRNGRQLEDPIGKAKPSEVEKESNEPQGEETRVESEKPATPIPYKPKIPFPQRFAKSKLDEQFKKFIEMMNKLYIDVPFTEVLTQMPTYAKFLKEILSKKRKIEEDETFNLTKECSVIIQNKLPPKLKDPGSFSVPCAIGSEIVKKVMCDLGASASLMPLSLFERMGIGELKSTRMTLQLADRSVKYPAGIVEDVPVKVGEIYIPANFVVMEIEEDSQAPILLGRPFLDTAGAIIDVKNGRLALNFGKDTVEFELANLMKGPSFKDSCYMIDIIDHCVKKCSLASPTHDGLELCLINNVGTKLEGDAQAYEELLDENPSMEELGVEELVEEELNPLPKEAPKV